MSMKFFTGLQDFLGLYDSTIDSSSSSSSSIASSTSPASHIASLFGATASNNILRSSVQQSQSQQPQQQQKQQQTHNNLIQQQQQQSCRRRSSVTTTTTTQQELGNNDRITQCSHTRNVHFPDDDTQLVTGYHEAPTNSFPLKKCYDSTQIGNYYASACKSAKIVPNPSVEHQIACFHQIVELRQECLSLKGQRLSQTHMECLEEIFKRVQFETLDFEYTFIDDDAAVSLAEMLEFYDSTTKLNLSFNKQINIRGWQALFRAFKFCPSLQLLNLRYTSLSDRAILALARTLRTQQTLTTLHLENVSLSGKNLLHIVCALKVNNVLRELYLGENNLQPADGAHLYQLIVGSSSIQMLDLRNNQLQDCGLQHICDALRNKETLEKSSLSALVLWNNRITSTSMAALSDALLKNSKLETLNIGNNNLSLEGVMALKPALLANTSLQRLGLQATNLNCQCAIILAECLADNNVMVRVDLRDNVQIGSAGLLALRLAMKMNTSITLLNLDNSCTKSSSTKVKEYSEQFEKYFNDIKSFCERNKKTALQRLCVQSSVSENITDSDSSCEEGQSQTTQKQSEESDDTKENDEQMQKNDESSETKEKSSHISSKQKSVDSPSHNRKAVWRFTRSSSLTCTELVEDINERIYQMSQSSSALNSPSPDETAPSCISAKATAAPLKAELSKSPSLPALPLLANATDSTQTIKKPNRRFSVSRSTYSASNPDLRRAVSPRFKVMPVSVPSTQASSQPTPSAPKISSIVVETKPKNPSQKKSPDGITSLASNAPKISAETPVTGQPADDITISNTPKIVDVSSKKTDENGNSTTLAEIFAPEQGTRLLNNEKKSNVDDGPVYDLRKTNQSTELAAVSGDNLSAVSSGSGEMRPIQNIPFESSTKRDVQKNATANATAIDRVVAQNCDSCNRTRNTFGSNVEMVQFSDAKPTKISSQTQLDNRPSKVVSCCNVTNDTPNLLTNSGSPNVGDGCVVEDENYNKNMDLNGNIPGMVSDTIIPKGTLSARDSNVILQPTTVVETSQQCVEKPSTLTSTNTELIHELSDNVTIETECVEHQQTALFVSETSTEASTSNDEGNECATEESLDGAESEDFVFVVKENTNERLPTGCSVEIFSQSDPESQSATIDSTEVRYTVEHSQQLASGMKKDSSGGTKQIAVADDMNGQQKCNNKDWTVPISAAVDSVESVSLKKPPDIALLSTDTSETHQMTGSCSELECLSHDKLKSWVVGVHKRESHFPLMPEDQSPYTDPIPSIDTSHIGTDMKNSLNARNSESVVYGNGMLCRPGEGSLSLNANTSDEAIVRRVVKDLVNFTSFEMGDDGGFRCNGSKSPSPSNLISPMKATRVTGFSPPRSLTSEMKGVVKKENDDEQVVHSVLRGLVREVLLAEKNALSESVKKKRERLNNNNNNNNNNGNKEIPSHDFS